MEEQLLDLGPRSRRTEGLIVGLAVGAGDVATSRVISDRPQTRTELAALLRSRALAGLGVSRSKPGGRARVTATR